jgi:hypothetical protein
VTVDRPMVETPLLLSSGGAAVTLLNWTDTHLDSVKVTIQLPFRARRVKSVTHGPVRFRLSGQSITCSLPLDAADILTLRP